MAVLEVQRKRTPPEVAMAQADNCLSIFRFADVMGSIFNEQNAPLTASLFERVFYDTIRDINEARDHFNRPRPYVANPQEIRPIVDLLPRNASYPGGHATFAYVTATLLADMVPEKAPAIFDRAAVYAHGRVVAGVHYPSDNDAGRISAAVIANALLHKPQFSADFARARAEMRHALNLPL